MDDHQQPLIDDDPTAGVAPSSCSCSAGAGANAEQPAPSKTYALGTLGFDYATEAHRDSLVQQGLGNPYDAATLAAFLVDHPSAATAVTFTLLQQQTPIYALQPAGAFAREGYARLVGLLATQAAEHVERMSFPGLAYGTTQLSSHQVVPVLFPEARGVFAWSTAELVQATVGEAPKPDDAEAHARHEEQLDGIRNFLERVYYDLRNLGQSSGDRALNFAATNAFQLGHVYGNAIDEGMVLDSISSSRSALSRPESDLWDVTIGFFDPKARLERAKAQYKFTVDVSYVVPVTVGRVRKFHSH